VFGTTSLFHITSGAQTTMDSHNIGVPELRRQQKWWFQDSGLRRMYFLIMIAVLSSATNGYDGSVLSTSN
jgi:hypothetical protein